MESSKPVIAIYDVRGIQNYIFKTNKIKEIIGASLIVDNLVINEFKNAVNAENVENVILNWEEKENLEFEDDENIQIEILYYGGGNLVALFRSEELCKKISVSMSKSIIKNARGLSLVYSYVPKTNDYSSDWLNLKTSLAKIKATTPLNKPAGVLPIVQYDKVTGEPLSKKINENGVSKKVSTEAYQKIKKYNSTKDDSIYIREFDKMRTNPEEGLLAVVHIDGNSMGMNIGQIMRSATTYKEAVNRMRAISVNIHKVFEVDAINRVTDKILSICQKHDVENLIEKDENGNILKLPFRKIISAGDDITFVCNERISLDIVKEYINAIRKGFMYKGEYPFSACAGIAIVHSHFPFYKAYNVAEQCCQSAKTRAKSEEGRINGSIGNYVDFQYCYAGNMLDLDTVRESRYKNIEGKTLLGRPYGIFDEKDKIALTQRQKEFDIEDFEKDLETMKELSRNKAKSIRDAYYETEAVVKTIMKRLNMKENPFNKNGEAEYYDALEFLDIYAIKEEK